MSTDPKTSENIKSSADFLKKRFNLLKVSQPSMSLTRFAGLIGVSSSFLKMVLAGHRKLTIEKSLLVSKALGLTPAEVQFLQSLIMKERGPSESQEEFDQIIQQTDEELNEKLLRLCDSSWLVDPYVIPITIFLIDNKLSTLLKSNIDDLCQMLSTKFKLEVKRVKQIVSAPELQRAVEREGIQLIYEHLIHVPAQRTYLKFWLTEGAVRLQGYPHSEDRFTSTTLTVSSQDRLELYSKLKELIGQYAVKKYQHPETLDLAQVNIQMLKLI